MGKFSIRYTKEKRDPPFAFKFNNNNYINGKIVISDDKKKNENSFNKNNMNIYIYGVIYIIDFVVVYYI